MNTISLSLLCLVALFYSIASGNCPEDETSSSSPTATDLSPSPSLTASTTDVPQSLSPSPSPTVSPLNDECPLALPQSCKNWYDLGIRESCYYPIYSNGDTVTHQLVYCDMEGTQCDGEGGWTRVGYLDMTQSGATCPTGLTLQRYDNIGHGLCSHPSAGCSSTFFPSLGLNYTNVCGYIRGYIVGSPDGFHNLARGVDSYYVDGVSIAHGRNPRQHIWTFAATWSSYYQPRCPCHTLYTGVDPTTTFLGNHYYCESGMPPGVLYTNGLLYASDPLWDGKQCDSYETGCCATNSKMPWFYRQLNEFTRDDIELRMCDEEGLPNEDTLLDIIELYIK